MLLTQLMSSLKMMMLLILPTRFSRMPVRPSILRMNLRSLRLLLISTLLSSMLTPSRRLSKKDLRSSRMTTAGSARLLRPSGAVSRVTERNEA